MAIDVTTLKTVLIFKEEKVLKIVKLFTSL